MGVPPPPHFLETPKVQKNYPKMSRAIFSFFFFLVDFLTEKNMLKFQIDILKKNADPHVRA